MLEREKGTESNRRSRGREKGTFQWVVPMVLGAAETRGLENNGGSGVERVDGLCNWKTSRLPVMIPNDDSTAQQASARR